MGIYYLDGFIYRFETKGYLRIQMMADAFICPVFPPRADAGQLEESGNIQLDYTPPDPQVSCWEEKNGSGSWV